MPFTAACAPVIVVMMQTLWRRRSSGWRFRRDAGSCAGVLITIWICPFLIRSTALGGLRRSSGAW